MQDLPVALLWGGAIIGGPILLGLALMWGKRQSAKRDKQIDPTRPSDDPAQGM